MRHAGSPDTGGQTWNGLANYTKYGWMASVSCSLEYCLTDMAIAHFCQALGDAKNYAYFKARAQGWKNIYNPANNFIQQRANQPEIVDSVFRAPGGRDFGFCARGHAQYLMGCRFKQCTAFV